MKTTKTVEMVCLSEHSHQSLALKILLLLPVVNTRVEKMLEGLADKWRKEQKKPTDAVKKEEGSETQLHSEEFDEEDIEWSNVSAPNQEAVFVGGRVLSEDEVGSRLTATSVLIEGTQ